MSLFSMAFAGGGLILLGSWESLTSTSKTQRFSTITLISASFLSLLFIFDSLLSIFDSFSSHDKMGPTLQLQVLAISSLFLLFSILGIFNNFSKTLIFPYPLINLILLFAFIEEFLLFHLQFKDVDGVENRYYDLMMVPILVCVISTIVELKDSSFESIESIRAKGGVNFAKLGRGLGLILQGTWFVQMGFSFFSDLIANNCHLHRKSRGNFTIQCQSHMDLHRGGAIAVLLFNCHLALLVAVVCGVYSIVGKRFVVEGDYRSYRPIGGEMQTVENEGKFTLDSDSDEGGVNEIDQVDGNVGSRRGNGSVELVVNGHGVH
ncbi:uncharacterized protein LOC141622529 [Silene latifolia]|uniref:uncharacterized protein LOC141622529 n=1 Tax=Silene latifolia TaxID=37657 RepID=UPI003D77BCF6